MNKSIKFRMLLAEQGIELTPEEAKELYRVSKTIIRKSKEISMQEFWDIAKMEVEGMTKEEIDQVIKLYQCAKEL